MKTTPSWRELGIQEAPWEERLLSGTAGDLGGAAILSGHLCWGRLFGDTAAFHTPEASPTTHEFAKIEGTVCFLLCGE